MNGRGSQAWANRLQSSVLAILILLATAPMATARSAPSSIPHLSQATWTNGAPLAGGVNRFVQISDDEIGNTTALSRGWPLLLHAWRSPWSTGLSLLAVAATCWFLYRASLRAVGARLRTRMDQQILERERLAREVHDGLIQGVQGLILRFQLIMEQMPPDKPQRAAMEAALDKADELLGQARDQVLDLRTAERTEDLEALLSKLARSINTEQPPAVFVRGTPRPLAPAAESGLLQLIDDILVSVRLGSQTETVEIRAEFGRFGLTASVANKGWSPPLDLSRLRERALRLQGRIHIDGQPGSGARVGVTIPARIAYAPRAWPSWRSVLARRFAHD